MWTFQLEILAIVTILFVILYFFGFWDYVSKKMSLTKGSLFKMSISAVAFYIVKIVGTYLLFAYLHKWLGPYIFGN